MTITLQITLAEKVLLAAPRSGSFTAAELVVYAFAGDRETFGLEGYKEQFPDSNKVLSAVMGKRGLVARGWFLRAGQKLYALTKEGRRRAAHLKGESEPVGTREYVLLSLEQGNFLLRLLGSVAYQLFQENRKPELTFTQASEFWGFTPATIGPEVDGRLKAMEAALSELEEKLAQEDGQTHNGRLVTAGEIRVLKHLSRYLAERFHRLLNLLRSRR